MTAQEFINQNQDILVSPVSLADFQNLTDGTPLFCITVAAGNKHPMDRAVKTAGYQMVVATTRNANGFLTDILTVALTKGGYAKVDVIDANDVGIGRTLLFHCKPLPMNDIRRNHHWTY